MSGQPNSQQWSGRVVTVTGGAGFLGSALVKQLDALDADVRVVRSSECDLRSFEQAGQAIAGADTVFHLAARVGGIGFNRANPGLLAYDNLQMGTNIFQQARIQGLRKLVAACSVCAYPKFANVPFKEDEIWDGYPEESNAPYGLAKKMLLVLSDAYRRQYGLDSCAPVLANLYGPNDNYDLEDSHVIAAMIRKFVEAQERGDDVVTLWGTGSPSREFLYVDDAARGLILAGERLGVSHPVNLGTGVETSIRDLAESIKELTGFTGRLEWDPSRPDGQPVRYLDVSRARDLLGFEAEVSLADGLGRTIDAYRAAPVGSGSLTG